MKTVSNRHWFFTPLLCFLVGSRVDSFSPSPSTRYVTFKVGNKAVLPCGWKPRLGEVTPPICHIQWKTPAKTVFELRGGRKWQAQELEGQANVPAETLESGDCSLIISDVQISDAGRYESFMVVDAAGRKSRVFIQSVQLSVFDHKSLQSHALGDDLVLDLYTPRAFMAIFQGRNSSDWSVLWTQGDNDSRRVQKDGLREQLTVKKLKPEDEGTYRVMDEHGLAISTVLLSVEDTRGFDENSVVLKVQQLWEKQTPVDEAVTISRSALLTLTVGITSVLVPHLP